MRVGYSLTSIAVIFTLALLFASSTACARSLISAKIVDAENGQPIQGTIVAYRWYKHKLAPPGMPAEAVTIEAGEEISDAEGNIRMPEYSTLLNDFAMVAYKKGYVCWSNRHIFPSWEERKGFKVQDGMVIRLERFAEQYSKRDHANFVSTMSTGLHRGQHLAEVLRDEMQLLLRK
jgi:hypothetical protein